MAPQPRALALAWLAGFLVLAGTVVAAGGHWTVALVHLGLTGLALASLGAASDAPGLRRSMGDLLPLVVAPLLYAEVPQLIAVLGSSYHDAAVQAWEAGLFHGQPSHALASVLPSRWISETLHAGYLAYYPSIFVPPLLLFAREERRGFAQTVLALTAAYTICWTIFALFPVEGPRYLWSSPPGVPDGPFRELATSLLAAGSSRGAAFPSSHMAVSVTQAMLAWRWQRRASVLLWGVALLVGGGAVYGGFHYAVDMVAGAILGAVVSGLVLISFRPAQDDNRRLRYA